MRLTQIELGLVILIIAYVAFFTHPPPSHFTDLLSTPVGHALALLGLLYVTVYKSLIVGVFLGLAYIMTARNVTEYLDPKEQTPKKKEEPKQPAVSMQPSPAVKGIVGSMMKGDMRLPMEHQKKGTPVEKPKDTTPVKGSAPKTVETFASF
jgi:hypothetical protein